MKLKILLVAALLVAGCSSDPNRLPPTNPFKPDQRNIREMRLQAGQLYREARRSLDNRDYVTAVEQYDKLSLRFPFSDYATQGQLEKIYALYRSHDPDSAMLAAERFLRERPRHPNADYVQYLKGLINFDRQEGLTDVLGLDPTTKDMGYPRRSFDDLGLLVQKYPNSRYAADARQRMVFLRNRIAESEMHIVHFYMRRGAYIAAAKRGEQIIAQYPGAPVTLDALGLIEQSYRAMDLNQQADEAAKLRAAYSATPAAKAAEAVVTAEAPAATPPKKDGKWIVEIGGTQLIGPEADAAVVPPVDGAAPDAAAAAEATATPKKARWVVELGDEQVIGPEAEQRRSGGTATPAAPAEPPAIPAEGKQP
jgi:outer membrane protein assembly factor BamD